MEPLPLPTQEASDVVIDVVDPPVTKAVVQPQEPVIASRRSTRTKKSAIPDDYVVYLGEHDFDIGPVSDPITYKDVVTCPQSSMGSMLCKMRLLPWTTMVYENLWNYLLVVNP